MQYVMHSYDDVIMVVVFWGFRNLFVSLTKYHLLVQDGLFFYCNFLLSFFSFRFVLIFFPLPRPYFLKTTHASSFNFYLISSMKSAFCCNLAILCQYNNR